MKYESGNEGASGGAVVAVAVATVAPDENANAIAGAAVDAEDAAVATDAAADAEAKNVAAVVAVSAAVGEEVALARGQVEEGGANVATGEGAAATKGGISGHQRGVPGEGVGTPIPVGNQAQENSLRITMMIQELADAIQ